MTPENPTPLSLPPRLDGLAADALLTTLKDLQGQPLAIDGSEVTAAGTLGVQALVAAHRTWRSDNVAFTLDPASDPLKAAAASLGIPFDELGIALQLQVTP